MKCFAIGLLTLLLAGCEDPYSFRNSPQQQVADYSICIAGGMRAYLNSYAEIKCAPQEQQVKP